MYIDTLTMRANPTRKSSRKTGGRSSQGTTPSGTDQQAPASPQLSQPMDQTPAPVAGTSSAGVEPAGPQPQLPPLEAQWMDPVVLSFPQSDGHISISSGNGPPVTAVATTSAQPSGIQGRNVGDALGA